MARILDAVHTQFEQDFIVSKPTWPNKRVALKGILKLLKKRYFLAYDF